MAKSIFKSDKYKRVRGGYSRLLDISCAKCGAHLFYYQKDGPGMLKRTYLDRIYGSKTYSNLQNENLKSVTQLVCPHCKTHIGVPFNYAKEDRLAYRLFVGAVSKKIANSAKIKLMA
ncbi:MAG TPA: hypothetical protein VMR46_01605 [Candidatus Paceibacterota bacterium]|nr:hypothetical protein [Candidatus Paceibacterota bacterium]